MERLDLPYRELSEQWLKEGLKIPAGLQLLIEEKHALLQSVHRAHPDQPCRACGKCCATFPFTTRYVEYRWLMQYLESTLSPEQKRRFVEERLGRVTSRGYPSCPFIDCGLCLVYRARPLICRRSVAGESICLSFKKEDYYPAWTGREESFRFLALNCLVNYLEEAGSYREIGLAVPGRGTLTMAPFEFWFLLELGHQETVLYLEAAAGYHPPLGWAGGVVSQVKKTLSLDNSLEAVGNWVPTA